MNIHDEIHRLILRVRWIRWSLRTYKYGDYALSPPGRHQVLSERLATWMPTWAQRQPEAEEDEMSGHM